MRKLNLCNLRFGKLLVISENKNFIGKKKQSHWNCICECGKSTISAGWLLKKGKIKSCGCLYLKINRSGEVHGKWTVLDYAGDEFWNCICECGTKKRVSCSSLSAKKTNSCGCSVSPPNDVYMERKKNHILSNITITSQGCWDWNLYKSESGYGVTSWRRKQGQRVNRIVWMLWNGEIPENMLVCHRCDRPQCCNPNHLFLGTHEDNMRDMAQKGRACQGENSHLHKTKRLKHV